jgi:hypothetical protein
VRRPAQQDLQVTRRVRLRQVVPRARLQRLDARRDARVAGRHDHDRIRLGLQAQLQQLEPRHLRDVQVEQHHIEPAPLQQLVRLLPPTTERDVVTLHPQDVATALPQRPVVVDHQHANRRLGIGRQEIHADFAARLITTAIRPIGMCTHNRRFHRHLPASANPVA